MRLVGCKVQENSPRMHVYFNQQHKKNNVQLHDRMSSTSLYIRWGQIKMKCRYEKKKSISSKTISILGIWMTFYGVVALKGKISAHTKNNEL